VRPWGPGGLGVWGGGRVRKRRGLKVQAGSHQTVKVHGFIHVTDTHTHRALDVAIFDFVDE